MIVIAIEATPIAMRPPGRLLGRPTWCYPRNGDPVTVVEEMRQKLADIEALAAVTYGANEIEHLLTDRLKLVVDHPESRGEFERQFIDMLIRSPDGTVMTMEFVMHALRWEAIRVELQRLLAVTTNWNDQRVLERILAVFDEDWEDADVYDYYRID